MTALRLLCWAAPLVLLSYASQDVAADPFRVAESPGPAAKGTAKPIALTADVAAPYFQRGKAGNAAKRFALEDWQAARDGFAAHKKSARLDRATTARLDLLIALCDTRLGQWSRAAKGFERAARGLPLLADYIHYNAARAHYFAHRIPRAMTYARKVAANSIVGSEAELLIGDLLRSTSDYRGMVKHYGDYLARRPKGIRRAEARYRLAQAYESLGQKKAVPHYRKVAIASPLSSWGKKAKKRFDALVGELGPKARKRYQTLIADELIERGMVYYGAMRNPLSEADFAAALQAPGLTAENRCVASYYRANSVFKARNRKRAAPLFDRAIAACKKASPKASKRADPKSTAIDLQVKAAYQAGRSYAFIGQHQTAIKRYRQAETVSPRHTYVDDARLRQAEEWTELGNQQKVTQVLASIPKKYPQGDMRAEAMWRLGWRAYRNSKYKEALSWLRKQVEVMPIDNNYWAEGQAQYWMGRAHAKLGQKKQAVASYRQAIARYPLSYYAFLALERLRVEHPRDLKKALAEIRAQPKSPKKSLRFSPRPEYASDAFARALEFIRLGLGPFAEAELRRIGMNIPPGRAPVSDPERIEKIWATAFLYDRAGLYSQSHWPTRWHVLGYKRQWPVGVNRERWRIAYPRGYWHLLNEHAEQHGFPTELLIAIVREESAFDPLRESYANAIGLTQMIFPTARRFGKGTGIDITRANLRDPEKNVTVGSIFLAFLWDKWKEHALLVPPSYNAGENAVARWLKERGTLATDEWIETIKADQPRRYSKRVLASYFTYSYLYNNAIPEISFTIPKSLIPGTKKKSAKKSR